MSEYSIESGLAIVYYRPTAATITVMPQGTPISGIDGDDGADGKTVRYGTGAPSNGLGVDGDFYIDTALWNIYGPKSAGVWPAGVSLIGPTGSSVSGGVHSFMFGGM